MVLSMSEGLYVKIFNAYSHPKLSGPSGFSFKTREYLSDGQLVAIERESDNYLYKYGTSTTPPVLSISDALYFKIKMETWSWLYPLFFPSFYRYSLVRCLSSQIRRKSDFDKQNLLLIFLSAWYFLRGICVKLWK